jgi:hypothetical protein
MRKKMAKRVYIKKPSDKKDDWALLKMGIVVIFCVFIVTFIINAYFVDKKKEAESNCRRMEYDAQNTLTAIADYYANPDHIDLPTFDQLVEEVDLITTFPVKIEGNPEEVIIVTVIDHDDKCPKGKKYVAYMGDGGEPGWQD